MALVPLSGEEKSLFLRSFQQIKLFIERIYRCVNRRLALSSCIEDGKVIIRLQLEIFLMADLNVWITLGLY